mmetsp:Transcript_32773/g.101500  ORF Transcript_32773/g.101500 Transcript_32773/m.101500 type:complete len:274 (-) Transcript_32773:209-1030(-)
MSHGTRASAPTDASTSSRSSGGAPSQISGYRSRLSRSSAFLAFWRATRSITSRSSPANANDEPPPESTSRAFRIVEPALTRCRESCSPTSAGSAHATIISSKDEGYRSKTSRTPRSARMVASRFAGSFHGLAAAAASVPRTRCRAASAALSSSVSVPKSSSRGSSANAPVSLLSVMRGVRVGNDTSVRPSPSETRRTTNDGFRFPGFVEKSPAVQTAPAARSCIVSTSSALTLPQRATSRRAASTHSMYTAPEMDVGKRSAPITARRDATTVS